jgi:insulysin
MPIFKNDEDMKQLIRHKYIHDKWDPDRIQEIANVLADPSKCLALVASKSFDESTLPIKHYFYKFGYSLEKFDDALLESMRNPVVVDNGKALDFPPPNNLIPTNFDILPKDESLSAKPILLQQWDDRGDLWYKKDDKFQKPKAFIASKIYTNDLQFGSSPRTRMFANVWKQISDEVLREFTYMADCANLKFGMTLLNDNIDMQWSGWNDSMPNFINETLKIIVSMADMDLQALFD